MTAGEIDSSHDVNQDVNKDNDNSMMSNMMTMLQQMNENLSKINKSNEELKFSIANRSSVEDNTSYSDVLRMPTNLTTLHAKMDQHFASRSKSESTNCSTILRKLNELQEEIKCNYQTLDKAKSKSVGKSVAPNSHKLVFRIQ